jgi:hypothetical protein
LRFSDLNLIHTRIQLVNWPLPFVLHFNVHHQDLSALTFTLSGLSVVCIEEGNANFRIVGDCIVDVNGIRLVSYLGSSSNLIVSRDIEILGSSSCGKMRFAELGFEPASKLSRILDYQFQDLHLLRL